MYEMKTRVGYSQVGSDLRVPISGIVQMLQDCTLFHSESIGKGLEQVERSLRAWFLSSWQIEIMRYPCFKEELVVRTWPHEFKGMYGYRNFDILDGNGSQLIRANSIWIFMDLEHMRPTKPEQEDLEGYNMEPALDMEYAPRKIKMLPQECRREEIQAEPILVKPSFLDSNRHVNNGRYVTEALDFLPEQIHEVRVDYRRAAGLGDVMYPILYKNESVEQIAFVDAEQNPYVIIEVV